MKNVLKRAFKVKISFPSGTAWLPDEHLTVDDWLVCLAETDEELKELNTPTIRFLQKRWRSEKLLQIKRERPSDRRSILAMYVGHQAYILFFDGVGYQVIAAIVPNNRPTLYRAVIGTLLENPSFMPDHPTSIKSFRPDLVPVDDDAARGIKRRTVVGGENFGGLGGPVDWMHPGSKTAGIGGRGSSRR